uniref:Peroxisomal hydratase-dehydrogenase-epimerase n=1 Tax=Ganoderma boninense TaxID=34458 RepID=A0A5K1K6X0_9APHY|nr:Peroxisomal hydratase-dehydrogenase-epimerase [Ganoderma boninense]
MSSVRYNLRNRPSGPHTGVHSGLAPPPGTLPAQSPQGTDVSSDSELSDAPSVRSSTSVRPGVSYHQAASTNVGANTGSLRDQVADPRAGADPVLSNEREADLCSVTPQPSAVGSSPLSTSDKENNNISSSAQSPENPQDTMAAQKEPVDKDVGQWTELPVAGGEGQLSDTAGLNHEQRHTVKAAEKSLTDEQRGCIQKRMLKVHHNRAASSSSRGEGPSTFAKGKSVDARNWGAAGISDEELDPDAQR